MSATRVENLRAWQLTYNFKLAVYRLLESGPVTRDSPMASHLRESAASAVSQFEEGFARFYPKDFGRMVVGAKASLLECCGHLRDAVDRGHIASETQQEVDALAREALKEVAGLLDYLQSPEAERNAKRIKEKRAERRRARNQEPRTKNNEPRTEPGTEPRTEPGTRTGNPEPGTGNG